MALPELDVARVQRWCAARVPEHARHQVHVECELAPRHLTIVERRAPWREDVGPEWTSFPIARLRYTATDKSWTLYWRDRNLRFHSYDLLAPSQRVEDLLTEIDRDPSRAAGRRRPLAPHRQRRPPLGPRRGPARGRRARREREFPGCEDQPRALVRVPRRPRCTAAPTSLGS
jgi:hypothetical protein